MAGALPLDIEEKILINLPAKSLNRFRCVSKLWQSLISDQRFVRNHLTRAAQSGTLILIDLEGTSGEEKLCQFTLSSLRTNGGGGGTYLRCSLAGDCWQLLSSCDGLLCIYVDQSVYLWNPCLNNIYRKIVAHTGTPYFNDYMTDFFELGYDQKMDDYKLLHLSFLAEKDIIETYIYSLKSDSWTRHENFPRCYFPLKSVFFDGSFHWLACGKPNSSPFSFALFSFDLSERKYREVLLPNHRPIDPSPEHLLFGLCVLQRMLGVLVRLKSRLVLWVMDKKQPWTIILDVSFELDLSDVFGFPADIRPLYMYENGEVLMGAFSARRTEVIMCKDCTALYRMVIMNKPSTIYNGLVHFESLITPCRVDDASAIGDKREARMLGSVVTYGGCCFRFLCLLTCLGRLFCLSC